MIFDGRVPTVPIGVAGGQRREDGSSPYAVGGTLLDRYAIFGIRQGGFGQVLFVTDRDGRTYAAKTWRPAEGEWRPDPEEFRVEAAFWIGLAPHPNIVRAYFVEVDGDQPFLFLEYVDGGARTSLRDWIRAGPIDERQALAWAYGCCVGMELANRAGEVAHLDLKPENLLVDRDGTIKITDFGLARKIQTLGGSYPRALAGTWPYAAPELFAGKPAGSRSDIYALGVIVFEMLTGRLPYPFAAASTSEELYRQLKDFHARGGAHKLASDLYYGKGPRFRSQREVGVLLNGCLDDHDRVRSFGDLLRLMERLFPDLKPDSAPEGTALPEDDLYQRALGLHRLGRFSEALRVYNQLLQRSPQAARFWLAAAETLAATGDADGAREFLETALARDPKLDDARRLLEAL